MGMKIRLNVEGKPDKVVFHKEDMWSLDITLAKIIVPALKKFKKEKHGYPGNLLDETDETPYINGVPDAGEKKWNAMLDQMIEAFELCLDEERQFDEEAGKRCEDGIALFAEYYRSLWI